MSGSGFGLGLDRILGWARRGGKSDLNPKPNPNPTHDLGIFVLSFSSLSTDLALMVLISSTILVHDPVVGLVRPRVAARCGRLGLALNLALTLREEEAYPSSRFVSFRSRCCSNCWWISRSFAFAWLGLWLEIWRCTGGARGTLQSER